MYKLNYISHRALNYFYVYAQLDEGVNSINITKQCIIQLRKTRNVYIAIWCLKCFCAINSNRSAGFIN